LEQKNILQELGPLPYALFKAIDSAERAFYDSVEEYKIFLKNNNTSNTEIAGQSAKIFTDEMMKKYDFSMEDLVNSVPERYRPYARILANMNWSDAVSFLSTTAKEFGKTKDGYLSVEEVFDKFKTKAISHFIKYFLTH